MNSKFTSKYLPKGTDLEKLRNLYKEFKDGKSLEELQKRYAGKRMPDQEPVETICDSEDEPLSEDEAMSDDTLLMHNKEDNKAVEANIAQDEDIASEDEDMSDGSVQGPTESSTKEGSEETVSSEDEILSEDEGGLLQQSFAKKTGKNSQAAILVDEYVEDLTGAELPIEEFPVVEEECGEDPMQVEEEEEKSVPLKPPKSDVPMKKYLPGSTEIDPTEFYNKRKLLKLRKKERELTAGDKWNHLKAPEVTRELKNEISVINNKQALDSKTFFKKGARSKGIPKHFHYGTVVETRSEYYQGTKKESKKSLVQTLLDNAEWHKSIKTKVSEIMAKRGRQKKPRNISLDKRRKKKRQR